MARLLSILAAVALAQGALAQIGYYQYVYGKSTGGSVMQGNEFQEVDVTPIVNRDTYQWPNLPAADHLHVTSEMIYEYVAAEGAIRQYNLHTYKPSYDNVVISIGTGKADVFVFAAEKMNQFWWTADSKLWTCALNACPQTARVLVAAVDMTGAKSMQLMVYNSRNTIMLRRAAGHAAWDAATGEALNADALETFTHWYWGSHTTYCQTDILFFENDQYCANGDTVFKNRQRIFQAQGTISWMARSMKEEVTTYVPSGSKLSTWAPTLGSWWKKTEAALSPSALGGAGVDKRFDGVPGGSCGNGVCDADETHASCSFDCCPAGAAAWPGTAKVFCNVTCSGSAGFYIPPHSTGSDCAAFACPAGTRDDDGNAATPCVSA